MALNARLDLESLGHVCFIAACCAIASIAVARHLQSQKTEPPPVGAMEAVVDGLLVTDRRVGVQDSRLTTLVVFSPTCVHCQRSIPFYRALADRARASNGQLRVVFASREPLDETNQYLRAQSVLPDDLVPIPQGLPILGTPMLLLIDRAGIVQNSWLGKLNPEQERVLVTMLP
jgi:hypothetical protein